MNRRYRSTRRDRFLIVLESFVCGVVFVAVMVLWTIVALAM